VDFCVVVKKNIGRDDGDVLDDDDDDDDDGNVGVELFFWFVFGKLSFTDLHVKPLVSELPSCSALARTQDP
jgi:hypothetical protein